MPSLRARAWGARAQPVRRGARSEGRAGGRRGSGHRHTRRKRPPRTCCRGGDLHRVEGVACRACLELQQRCARQRRSPQPRPDVSLCSRLPGGARRRATVHVRRRAVGRGASDALITVVWQVVEDVVRLVNQLSDRLEYELCPLRARRRIEGVPHDPLAWLVHEREAPPLHVQARKTPLDVSPRQLSRLAVLRAGKRQTGALVPEHRVLPGGNRMEGEHLSGCDSARVDTLGCVHSSRDDELRQDEDRGDDDDGAAVIPSHRRARHFSRWRMREARRIADNIFV